MTKPSANVRKLAVALREVLDVPAPDSYADHDKRGDVLATRAAFLVGALGGLAAGDISLEATTAGIQEASSVAPITYTPYRGDR